MYPMQPGAMPQQPQQPMPQAQGGQPPQGGMQQLDPAMIQAIIGMRGQPTQQAQIQRQLKMADMMRADAGQQLKGTQAGRVYKAPGALNLGANVLGNFMAARGDQQAAGAEKQMMGADQDAARKYYEAIMQQQMQQQMRQQPQAMPSMAPQGGTAY